MEMTQTCFINLERILEDLLVVNTLVNCALTKTPLISEVGLHIMHHESEKTKPDLLLHCMFLHDTGEREGVFSVIFDWESLLNRVTFCFC